MGKNIYKTDTQPEKVLKMHHVRLKFIDNSREDRVKGVILV